MKKLRTRRRSQTAFNALIVLFFIVISIVILAPMLLTITNSLMTQSEISANYGSVFSSVGAGDGGRTYISERVNLKFIPDAVSLSQYISVFIRSSDYLVKFWNSVLLVLPIVVFQILVACLASYGFARFKSKFRGLMFFGYIILMLMPYQVTLVPNYLVSDWLGILDTRLAIILPGVFSPFSVFIITKYIRRIPRSIFEAAKIDGANEFQMFWRICMPICRSTIYSVAILVFIDYWNMVEQPLILLSDPQKHPLSVFLSQINAADAGIAFAAATFYMIPALLIFLYSEDYLIDGIAYSGSIKS